MSPVVAVVGIGAAGSARYSFYLATFLFGTYLAVFCCLVVVGAVAGMWWRGTGCEVTVTSLALLILALLLLGL